MTFEWHVKNDGEMFVDHRVPEFDSADADCPFPMYVRLYVTPHPRLDFSRSTRRVWTLSMVWGPYHRDDSFSSYYSDPGLRHTVHELTPGEARRRGERWLRQALRHCDLTTRRDTIRTDTAWNQEVNA